MIGLEHVLAFGGDLAGLDAIGFVGQRGLAGEAFRIVDLHVNVSARHGLDAAQDPQQRHPRLHVFLGHLGADEGLDLHRTLHLQRAEQLDGLRRQRAEFLAREVEAKVVVAERAHDARPDQDQGQGAD